MLLIIFLFVLSVLVFCLARLSPGDPLYAYFGDSIDRMNQSQKDTAFHILGLDDSFIKQYSVWISNFFQGDMGISYQYKQPVSQIISSFWFNTLLLGGISYILTFLFAILLGVFCARHEGSILDNIIRRIGTVTSVIPSFFAALILILLFSVNLGVLPMDGAYSLGNANDLGDRLSHLILPVSVMILSHVWYYAYMIRNKMIEELSMEYVSLLKIKGVKQKNIVWGHCFRNIMPAVISIMVVSIPHIIGGTYVVEMVFSYPGLGTLSFESALYNDYNMLSALCLITGFFILIFNIIGEEISKVADPRIRNEAVLYG